MNNGKKVEKSQRSERHTITSENSVRKYLLLWFELVVGLFVLLYVTRYGVALFQSYLKKEYLWQYQVLLWVLFGGFLLFLFYIVIRLVKRVGLEQKNRAYVTLSIVLVMVFGSFALNYFFSEYLEKFPLEFKSLKDQPIVSVRCWSVSKYFDVTTEDTMLCEGRFNNTYSNVLDIQNVTIEHGSYSRWINTNTRHNITTTCNQGPVTILPNNTGSCTFKFWFEDIGLNKVELSFTPGAIHIEKLENGTGAFTPNSKFVHVTFNSVESVFTNATYGESIDLRIENPVEVITSDKVEERRNTRITGFFISISAIIFSVFSGVQNLKSIIKD